ncbi:NADH:ubiquinone oxidoreductase subunit 4L [Volvox carteri f. nagariensis]|uniref:NADH:ubiquinone oxidoreductase subunit 4L n=1 Tax=Volvox carteri f. nagariensis TaxID=3068 RepID=D8ULH9_VOLCA|nr:NADH:ubiquinone oxidoreductase subunit 4L [Volvox carteri f. nagariensis]EFJ39420.1 NADH:ubiquinone oxidoreductase subunit 4L [Volvox carteri f. nagariensis]|eukprot:XP_002959515.1 NADH:ubiquinone oxidoreductase subunit 4L [Volvox carteri f. nagariensis]
MARTQLLRRLLPFPGTSSLLPKTTSALPSGINSCSFTAISSKDDDEQRAGSSISPGSSLLQLANFVNRPLPVGLGSSAGSFAAAPILTMAGRRRVGALSSLRRPLVPVPGMGTAAPVRSYYTEGEIFGTTFMYTTNMMFWAGIVGAVAFRRNLIILLLSAETVMLACNMNFLFTAAYLNDITGAIMSITITTIAACETAIGLALCVAYFHMRSATDVEALNLLK